MAYRKKKPTKQAAIKTASKSASGAAIQAAIAEAVRLRHGGATYLGDSSALSEVTEVIPTGIDVVDRWVLGIGGLPVGRMVEVASKWGGGKSTIAMTTIARVQAEAGISVLSNDEDAFTIHRAQQFGVRPELLTLLQPSTFEEAVDGIWTALEAIPAARDVSSGPALIVWDSVPGRPTKRELGGEDPTPGEHARIMTTKFKRVLSMLAKKRCCLLALNQIREAIGSQEVRTPGGNYFAHAASVRVMISGGAKIVDTFDDHIGKDVTFYAFKNRFTPPYRKARVRLYYGDESHAAGWDNEWSTVELAKTRGLISEKRRKGRKTVIEAYELLGWPAPAATSAQDDGDDE